MPTLTKPKTLSVDAFDLNGETVTRVIMEINGQAVQVLSYGTSPLLNVVIGDNAAQVHLINLDAHIADVIGGNVRR